MKKLKQQISMLALIVCMCFSVIATALPIHALEEEEVSQTLYQLVDFAHDRKVMMEYPTYHEALLGYDACEGFEHKGIVKDGKVLLAKYAMVYFNKQENEEDLYFVDEKNEKRGSLNGKYAIDGAYITTDRDQNVHFYISGMHGVCKSDEVEIVPIDEIKTRLSHYIVKDGHLYHEIKTNMDVDYYSNILYLGEALPYLKEGCSYYSYDGHYFYEQQQIEAMLDDYKEGEFVHSVNATNPYYDYYKYVSIRSQTCITSKQLEQYMVDVMGIKKTPTYYVDDDCNLYNDILSFSALVNQADTIFESQYQYGINALMLFAMAQNESGNGRSLKSYRKQLLFDKAAFDTEEELYDKGYASITRSILCHAKYTLSGDLLSPLKQDYHGACFGDFSTGMNVCYSSDPYWGEKSASAYRSLDEYFGGKEYKRYTIAIAKGDEPVFVYEKPNHQKVLYDTGLNNHATFLILGEITTSHGSFYRIQTDATLDQNKNMSIDYNYSYLNHVGYINREDVEILHKGIHQTPKNYVRVTFDGNGGVFENNDPVVSYFIEEGKMPSIISASKDHAYFVGFEPQIQPTKTHMTYYAQFKEVDHIEMASIPKTTYYTNEEISLEGGSVRIVFKDHKRKVIPLKRDMVTCNAMHEEGQHVVQVKVAGCVCEYPIEVIENQDILKIKQQLLLLGKQYETLPFLSDDQKDHMIRLKKQLDEYTYPPFTMPQVRTIDHAMHLALEDRIRYRISPNAMDVEVSGLSLSVPLGNSLFKKSFFEDTYRVNVNKGIYRKQRELLSSPAWYIGEPIGTGFTLKIYKNYHNLVLEGPLVLSMQKPTDHQDGDVYSVLMIQKDGNVRKCYTRQSEHRISFMVHEGGEYQLVRRRTSNAYKEKDPREVLDVHNQSFDMEFVWVIFSIVGLSAVLVLYVNRDTIKKHRETKVEKRRLELQEKEKEKPLPPADVTQALEVLNTEMIRLEEIREAERELDQKEGKKND